MDKKTAKAIRRVESRMVILGPFLREKGAAALFGTAVPEAVDSLVKALGDKKEKVRRVAHLALVNLKGPAIDRLCAIWEESRDEVLERLIWDGDYFAVSPRWLGYITYLLRGWMEKVVDADADGVNTLLALRKDKDWRIAANSKKALSALRNQDGIDRLCAFWEQNRDETLKKIIGECGYIARNPPALFYKTSYFHGKAPEILPDGDILNSCLSDSESAIMKNAIAHELSEGDETGFYRLWQFAMQRPDLGIAEILYDSGRFPQDAAERTLFFFLAGAMDHYFDIDFDQSVLRTWYESGSAALKESVARRIRQTGDARLLTVFRNIQGGPNKSLSAHEVDVQIDIMIKNEDFAGLFDLFLFSNYDQATRIFLALKQGGWYHPEPRFAEMQARLEPILMQNQKTRGLSSYAGAVYRDFRPMFFHNGQVPQAEEDLPAWAADDKNFRKRTTALIVMAESGSPALEDAANLACSDACWQVRMAAAAAELLRPGTLSPSNRALLAEDHVFWVKALLNLPADGRLSGLGPAGLEILNEGGEVSGPAKKATEPDDFMTRVKGLLSAPEREYFLILGEYFSTEGEFSEDSHVEAGMADVEVVFEE